MIFWSIRHDTIFNPTSLEILSFFFFLNDSVVFCFGHYIRSFEFGLYLYDKKTTYQICNERLFLLDFVTIQSVKTVSTLVAKRKHFTNPFAVVAFLVIFLFSVALKPVMHFKIQIYIKSISVDSMISLELAFNIYKRYCHHLVLFVI